MTVNTPPAPAPATPFWPAGVCGVTERILTPWRPLVRTPWRARRAGLRAYAPHLSFYSSTISQIGLQGSAFHLNVLLDGQIAIELANFFRQQKWRLVLIVITFLGMTLVLVYDIIFWQYAYRGLSKPTSVTVIEMAILLPLGLICVASLSSIQPTRTVVGAFLELIESLDEYNTGARTDKQRVVINRRITALAREISRYPHKALGSKNREADKIALRRAASITSLQRWVLTPLDSNTFWYLLIRVNSELTAFLVNGWHIPVDTEDSVLDTPALAPRRLTTLRWVGGAVTFVLLAGSAIYFHDEYGIAGQFVIVLSFASALFCLIRAGLPLNEMKEIYDLAKNVKGIASTHDGESASGEK